MAETVFTLVTKTTTLTGAGDGVAMEGAKGCLVHAVAATASTSTILIQGSLDNSVWFTLATITDVGASPNGTAYIGDAWPYIRANVSAHSGGGTITVTAVALDWAPGYWNVVTRAVDAAGALTVTNVTDSGLTSGRIPYASTGGLLVDAAGLAFNGTTLVVPNCTNSSLTTTRVPYTSTAGLQKDEAAFTYIEGTNTLNVGKLAGTLQLTSSAKLTDGAISATAAHYFITKGSALGSSTVANPTSTTDDGIVIQFTSTTAFAHVVSFNSGKVNGGSNTTVTLTSAAIGDGFTIQAYQGVYYIVATVGTITVT